MMEMEMNAELERDGGSEEGEPSSEGSSAGTVFCTLEQDYARILNEMKSNVALAPYEAEYTRLFESLYKTHRNEDELTEKCRLLQEEVMLYIEKIEELEKTVEIQEQNIAKLNQEVFNAKKLSDAAHSREQNAQEMIENLRTAVKKLNQELGQRNKLVIEQEISESKQNEGLISERERLTSELEALRERIRTTSKYNNELEKKVNELETQVSEIQENLDTQLNEFSKERRAREKFEELIQQLQEELKLKNTELQNANSSIKTVESHAKKLEIQLKDQKVANEKLQQEINKLLTKRMHMQSHIDHLTSKNEAIEHKLLENDRKIDLMRIDMHRIQDENSKLKSERELMSKKLLKEERLRNSIESNLKQERISHKNVDLEVYSLQKFLEEEQKLKDKALREKESLGKTVKSLKEKIEVLQVETNINEQIKKKMESNLEEMGQTNEDLKRKVSHIAKERDKYCHEAQELSNQIDDLTDKIKLERVEILDLKKRFNECESKTRQQQNAFEITKAENNTFAKHLTEAQDEIRELKLKLKVANKQIEQLKEEVVLKETNITKGEFLLGKVEKEKEDLKFELQATRKSGSSLRQKIQEMIKEEKHLRQTDYKAQMEINRQKKEIDTVLVERDVLGTQLVRRNDEISLLYSKIKVLEGTIQRGETQYNQRLEEIKLLKLEVKKLRSEKVLLVKNMNNSGDLRLEIFYLQQDLTRERLKVTALEEELQNPLNIHRWRKLEGTDPDTFELLKKVQILQKRVLKMSSDMVTKEKTIKYTEKLYANVREMLTKQPGPEVVAVLTKTQRSLVERGNKIKCILAERNMFESLSNEQKFEIEKLKKELNDLKAKYFSLKKKNQNCQDLQFKDFAKTILPEISSSDKKFIGGGFNMNVTTPHNCQKFDT